MEHVGAEMFTTYDGHNHGPTGQASRAQVHASGLYHRSVHVLLRDADARLLLQRRAVHKDVLADAWDLSCAEHLQPGETYAQGAQRGLTEELGITGCPLVRLRPPSLHAHVDPQHGVDDREFAELWQGVYEGRVTFNPDEVSAVRWVSWGELMRNLEAQPGQFTPWLRDEIAFLGRGPSTLASFRDVHSV